MPRPCRRCLRLISNVGHHVESQGNSISTAFAQRRLKCARSSLPSAVRASKSKCNWAPRFARFAGPACARRCMAYPGAIPFAPCLLPLTSLVRLSRQGAVHCEPGALRAEVSQLELPGPAGNSSALVYALCPRWQSRGSSRFQTPGRARACCPTLQSTGLPPAAGYLKR